jgi:hypothetical protein
MPRSIEPDKTVDREVEQYEFRTMLRFDDDARLLVIEDRSGTGKSTLLTRLRFNCRWEEHVPASLVLLEDDPGEPNRSPITNEFELASWIRQDLADDQLPFPMFDFLNQLRMQYQPAPFADSQAQLRSYLNEHAARQGLRMYGSVDAEQVNGGVVAGVYVRELRLEPQRSWAHPEQERTASQRCVEAFKEDLRQISQERPVVLLLDSYESRHPGLRDWLMDSFIGPLSLWPGRPDKLVVVLATLENSGPPFRQMLRADADRLIRSRKFLAWEDDHIRDFLTLHGYGGLSDEDVQIVQSKIRRGCSLAQALRLAQTLTLIAS